MRALHTFIYVFFLVQSQALATPQTFKVGDDQFTVDVPKNWQVTRDFFFPVGLGGEDNKEGHRTIIGITPAGVSDVNHVFDKGNKDVRSYTKGREEWVTENLGKTISYDPSDKTTWPGIEVAYTLGHHYEIPTGKFYERVFFVLCNGKRVFHIKSLVYGPYESTQNDLVDKTVRSLKCVAPAKSVAMNGGAR